MDELSQQLRNIIDHINTLMTKGKSWIEEKENMTYIDMNRFLTNETAGCLRRCLNVAGNLEDLSNSGANLASIQTSMNNLEGNSIDYLKYFERFDTTITQMELKQTDHEKQIEALTQQEEENYKKIANMEQKLKDHEGLLQTMNDEIKFQEVRNGEKLKDIEKTIQVTCLVDNLREKSISSSSEMQQIKKLIEQTSTKIANELSALKVSTDTAINSQIQKTQNVEKTMQSFSDMERKISHQHFVPKYHKIFYSKI